jgi:2-polyprenyl-3-methyl-5-hydroxy-6-metoxy-1,4-benzoquinol methylase
MSLNYEYHSRLDIVEFIPESFTKVLEIGCGKGAFLRQMRNQCEYWGIEPDAEAAKIASKQLARVFVGKFSEVKNEIPDRYFDLVICNDVIEHMDDHEEFLKDIRAKCVDNAHLIGSIPNVRYILNLYELLIKRDWRYVNAGILDRTHKRFFTEKSEKSANGKWFYN